MPTVTLNYLEREIACLMAVRRREAALGRGVTDRKVASRHPFFIELQGVCGELVVAKFLRVWPDTDFALKGRSFDLKTAKMEWRIDVKTTEHNGGRLIIPVRRRKGGCDIFVLVTGQMPHYRVAGWGWEEAVMGRKPVMWNKGMVYLLNQDEMEDARKLREM